MCPSRLALILPLALLLAGCGSDKTTSPPPLPIGEEPNPPAEFMVRLEKTLEYEDLPAYVPLLSEDFRYRFSPDADPDLSNRYPNWGKEDEVAAMKHLFEGFTNTVGETLPAATLIELMFTGPQFGPDPEHPDSTAQYQKVVVSVLDANIEIPGSPDAIVYHISARQDFYLVRGDAAVLSAGANADTTHWYVRRWEDHAAAPPTVKNPASNAATPATLGKLKSMYRN